VSRACVAIAPRSRCYRRRVRAPAGTALALATTLALVSCEAGSPITPADRAPAPGPAPREPTPEPHEIATPLAPAGAALEGDPAAQERAILSLDNADLPEDVLLALPGSEGIAVADDDASAIPEGGASIGTPQAGSLANGIQLPPRPHLYTRRDPARSFGSTHTIRTIQSALAAMRRERGHDAEVIIGDISLPRGGPFSPHVSHQAGRDVDIRLVLAAGQPRETLPSAPEVVDWDATWALVHSFLETGQVTHVFLGFERQGHLLEAARRAGVHDRVLDAWFQWPDPGGPGLIRHEDGHLAHVHVRLACGPAETRCTGV
jgi:hypothetical protein